MFAEKSLIYHLISQHNKKVNANKLFLSKEFRKRNDWFVKNIGVPFFLLTSFSSTILIFLIKDGNYNIFGYIILGLFLILLFSYRYFYFNRKAKKETGYVIKRNAFIDFFKWWFTYKLQKKQLKNIEGRYSKEKFQSLIAAAQLEYDFQKSKNSILHFETMLVAILAIVLTLTVQLDIIDGLLLKLNHGKELSFEDNFFVFKKVIGSVLLVLITYGYCRWNINQGYRDKKRKLKHFIQTMQLARGLKKPAKLKSFL